MHAQPEAPFADLPHPAELAPPDATLQREPSAAHGVAPPHSLDAERECLAAVLVDRSSVETIAARLTPSDFYYERHQVLFSVVLDLHQRGRAIDPVTLTQGVRDAGHFERIGGARGIGELLDRAGTVSNLAHYCDIVHEKARLRRLIEACRSVETAALSDVDDVDALLTRAEARIGPALTRSTVEAPQARVLSLEDLGDQGSDWLEDTPPARPILLTAQQGEPYMPDGKVCTFIGQGGAGKTFALTQLALAIASSSPWLETYQPHAKGRVLLALGEETLDEVRRRVWQCSRKLDEYSRSEVKRNVFALGLSGQPVSMLERNVDGNYGATPWFHELRAKLEAAGPWRCIILDPWSRWGGPDAENDAHAATRGVELLEQLTLLPGRPAVVIAHHTRKRMMGGRPGAGGADESRGSSALVDGARWCANLTRLDDEMLEVRVTKANYTVPGAPLHLMRAKHGVLRPATPVEVDDYRERSKRR